MDPSTLKRLLTTTGVDIWSLIDAAISLAATERDGDELRARRDSIVERLYAPSGDICRSCSVAGPEPAVASPPESPESEDGDGEDVGLNEVDDEKMRITAIKDLLEEDDQSDESTASLLQNLLDMDITFRALKDTDIGRHVNQLRKHPSCEVRQLAKLLVRKWKDIVDEWVKTNPSGGEVASPAIITDAESPQEIPRKHNQNGQQIRELSYSPNSQNGHLSNGAESVQQRAKTTAPPSQRREAPAAIKERKDIMLDADRLASARKRLHDNYQEVENAKKQRTIQVMDIHEIPKPKNSLARKGGFQAKPW